MLLKFILVTGLLACAAIAETDRALRLEEKFVAPCCWRESIARHSSPEAERMRAKVVELVNEGKTDEEIVNFFVSRFGIRILREPPGQKAVWLYILPVAVLVAGLFMLLRFVRKSLEKQRPIELQRV